MFDEGSGDYGNAVDLRLCHRLEQVARAIGIERRWIDRIARTESDTEGRDNRAAAIEIAREIIRQHIAFDIFEVAHPLAWPGHGVFKGADRYVPGKGTPQELAAGLPACAEDSDGPRIGHLLVPVKMVRATKGGGAGAWVSRRLAHAPCQYQAPSAGQVV